MPVDIAIQKREIYYIKTTLQLVLVPCGGGKRLPLHHHSADYISFTLGSLGLADNVNSDKNIETVQNLARSDH